jgi:hypothetical protein
MFRRGLAAATLTAACLAAASASAWNAVGHMAVGKLAYDRLSSEEQAVLTAVLAEHPHYEQYLSANRPDDVEPGAWAAMRAGVWPDWIRPPRRFEGDPAQHPVYRFHRGPWHYVNFPYIAGQSSDALPAKSLPAATDIIRQIPLCLRFSGATIEVDRDAEPGLTAAQNRAVRLCWLIHLVGDLHQPLHAASLIDERRLPGPEHDDQGGNLLAVRVEIGAFPTRLHGFWDQLPGTDNHPASVLRLVDELGRDAKLQPDQLPELNADDDVRTWTAESYAAAVKYAYLNGELPTAVWDDSRPPAVDDVPILPVGYERTARDMARRRLVVAAHRLAELLSTAAR